MKQYRGLIRAVRGQLLPYGASTLIVALRNFAITALTAWVSAQVLTAVSQGSFAGFWQQLRLFVWLILAFVAVDTFGVYWQQVTVHQMTNRVRSALYEKLLRAPLHDLSVFGQRGELLSRLNQDVDTASSMLDMPLAPAMYLVSGIGATLSIGAISLPVCILIYLYGALLLGFQVLIAKRSKRVMTLLQQCRSALLGQYLETHRGALTVRMSHLMDWMQARFFEKLGLYESGCRRQARLTGLRSAAGAVTDLFESVGILLIGIWLYGQGRIAIGSIVVLYQLSGLIVQMITSFGAAFSQLQGALVGLERIEALMALPQEDLSMDAQAAFDMRAQSGLAAQDLGLTFENGVRLYGGLTLQTAPHGLYALAGESGRGKTTLFRLLLGLGPAYEGTLTLYGKNVERYGPKTLRECITYVTQENSLFEGTILENLRWRSGEVLQEQVWTVLEKLGLADWLRGLPQGLNTPIPDGGTNFSGGQRKSLLLARALLENRQVLLLDEVFAGVDQDKIVRMVQVLRDLAERENRLILVITHDEAVMHACSASIAV